MLWPSFALPHTVVLCPAYYFLCTTRTTLLPLRHTAVSSRVTGTSVFPTTTLACNYMLCNTVSCYVSMPPRGIWHHFFQDTVSDCSIDARSAFRLLLLHGATCLDPAPCEDCTLERRLFQHPPAEPFDVRSNKEPVLPFRSEPDFSTILSDASTHLAVFPWEAFDATLLLFLRQPEALL